MQFYLGSIPVFIQPSFWIFLLLFSFHPGQLLSQMLVLGAVMFISLLFHEYGHALAILRQGKRAEITLEGFGGYASYDSRGLSSLQQLWITLSGPLFTALLIGIGYFCFCHGAFEPRWLGFFWFMLWKLNLYWLLVNLAPLQPLDGGKIACFFLQKWFGVERGSLMSLYLGNITAIVGIGYFLFEGSYLFAALFLTEGWKNLQLLKEERKKRAPNLFHQYQSALQALQEKEVAKGKQILEKLLKSKEKYICQRAAEALAELWEKQGEEKKVYRLLKPIPIEKLYRGKALLAKAAHAVGDDQLVASLSFAAYEIEPSFEIALVNAKSFCRLGQEEMALGWFKTVLGFPESQREKLSSFLLDPKFSLLLNAIKQLPDMQLVADVDSESKSPHQNQRDPIGNPGEA